MEWNNGMLFEFVLREQINKFFDLIIFYMVMIFLIGSTESDLVFLLILSISIYHEYT